MNINSNAEKFLTLIKKSRQGKLKIYLGLAAGVGKSYRMLQEAHELLKNGINVTVGYVETHGRKETEQLLSGLPLIPRKKIFYKGKEFEEFDIDAALNNYPDVVIVDELAHTNIPGSRNEKRWQDIEELIYKGINVISAVNIQHIESLNTVIENITGTEVKERIPDSVISLADEVVNIDITTDELLKRLAQGKIYSADKIQTALNNFFRKEHLLQLRELALREVADKVESKIGNEVPKTGQKNDDNILVCISSNDKLNQKIIRKSSRIAQRLDAKWFVIYVETGKQSLKNIDLKSQRHIINNLKLAVEQGASADTVKAGSVVEGILSFAKEKNVKKIILGKPEKQNIFNKLIRKNTIDELIEKTEDEEFDIEIIS
ncbi:MAG: sensor protein KdpD [Ignavibacteria bacterium]|nr:sensor protein KdpD [Ignavibacteria bacterium]